MRKHLFFSLLPSILFFCLACSGTVTDEESGSPTLTISLQGSALTGQTGARTVFPESWSYGSSSASVENLYFAISAYTVASADSSDTTPTGSYYHDKVTVSQLFSTVTYGELKAGSVSLALLPAIWRITLSAYKTPVEANDDGTIANTDMVLTATEYVTLTQGSKSSTLTLSLTTPESGAAGSFSVNLAFYPPDTFEFVTCELYDYAYSESEGATSGSTGSLVSSQVLTAADLSQEATGISNFSRYYYTPQALTFDLSGGTYLFIASFSDINNKYIGRYPLYAVIAPGSSTCADIILHRAAFNSAPLSCTNLSLQSLSFNNGSASLPIAANMSMATKAAQGLWQALAAGEEAAGTFSATFTWKDNADNEKGYQLQKASSSDGLTWSSWQEMADLEPGSSSYSGSFATGAQYKIRVKPYNDFSGSETVTGFDSYVESDVFGLFTVTYSLTDSAGKTAAVQTSLTEKTDSSITAFVIPYLYGDSENNTLLAVTASYPYIVFPLDYATGYSLHWENEGGTTLSDSDIGGHAGDNIIVWPVWTEN